MNKIIAISLTVILSLSLGAMQVAAGEPAATTPPQRVVSLVPAVSEIIFALGAGEAIVGVTIHDLTPAEVHDKALVGGFFSPSLSRIAALAPDLLIVSDLHREVREAFAGKVAILELPADSLEESLVRIVRLGEIFNRREAALNLVAGIRADLALITAKTADIPAEKRLRVMRLMGSDPFRAPGDDSFQNDFIRAAGGLAPSFGKNGQSVNLSPEEIKAFDPQVIYVCGEESREEVLTRPGLAGIAAIRDRRVYAFPCDLTCRAGVNMGSFVSWLSARVYDEHFSDPARQLAPDRSEDFKPLEIKLPGVAKAGIYRTRIRDFTNKTLILDFTSPQRIISTLEGERTGISAAGNHYYPPPAWSLGHQSGLAGLKDTVLAALARQPTATSLLFTGADMEHLAVVKKSHKDLEVYALVTAGVGGNAMRMGKDQGAYYEPGTINILLLANRRLSPRAMSRAIITATEAKSAALNDLDIRSSYQPEYAATGTGTDNVLVIEGEGGPADQSGGHTKMGELLAAAVYDGVRQAIAGQNGITAHRSIFARLKERRISLWELIPAEPAACGLDRSGLARAMENAMLDPEYAAFVASAMAAGDAEQAGLIRDRQAFARWAGEMAARLAGGRKPDIRPRLHGENLPPLLGQAFEAMSAGLCSQGAAR